LLARLLPLVTLVDELWSGVAVSGAPSVEHELGLSHTGYVTLAFAVPLVLAAMVESGIAVYSDVWDRRRLTIIGQGTLAISLTLLACTKSAWVFTVALTFAGAGSGVACSAAQAMLVTDAASVEQALVRWTLFASVGDVAAPIVTASALALGFSYRAAMLVVAVIVGLQCALLLRSPTTLRAQTADSRTDETLWSALQRAVRCKALWLWLAAAATCTLLDEIVVALAALRMVHDQGASPAVATAAAVMFSGGAILGSAVGDSVVARFGWRNVLAVSAGLCLVSLAAVVGAESRVSFAIALFAVGVTCAPHHALTFARAYETMPKNPGTVQAVGQLFVVVDILAPVILGVVADRWGLRAAMACLVVQPVIILACASRPLNR
jgi:MFS family permease